MTKQTYINKIKYLYTNLVNKYGKNHFAVKVFKDEIEYFTIPTDENYYRLMRCYSSLMRYGRDIEWEATYNETW